MPNEPVQILSEITPQVMIAGVSQQSPTTIAVPHEDCRITKSTSFTIQPLLIAPQIVDKTINSRNDSNDNKLTKINTGVDSVVEVPNSGTHVVATVSSKKSHTDGCSSEATIVVPTTSTSETINKKSIVSNYAEIDTSHVETQSDMKNLSDEESNITQQQGSNSYRRKSNVSVDDAKYHLQILEPVDQHEAKIKLTEKREIDNIERRLLRSTVERQQLSSSSSSSKRDFSTKMATTNKEMMQSSSLASSSTTNSINNKSIIQERTASQSYSEFSSPKQNTIICVCVCVE